MQNRPAEAPGTSEIELLAGPPAAQPPLVVGVVLVALSVVAPFLFLQTGAANIYLAVAILALAVAGMLTLANALSAQLARRRDLSVRPRASIGPNGIRFIGLPGLATPQHFARAEIESAHLLPHTLVVHTSSIYSSPGRHVMRFGKLVTSRERLHAALASAGWGR